MNNLVIRPATLEDFDIIDQFQVGLIEFERKFDPSIAPEKETRYYPRGEIEGLIRAKSLLVAEIDGKLVGCGFGKVEKVDWAEPRESGYIGFIYVLPEHRGKGVATAIISKLVEYFKAKGISLFRIKSYSDNERAINAYKKLGFVPYLTELYLKQIHQK